MSKLFAARFIFLLLIGIVKFGPCKAQVVYNASVKTGYLKILKGLKAEFKKEAGFRNSLALARVIDIREDTLNLKDTVLSKVTVSSIPTDRTINQHYAANTDDIYLPVYICTAYLKGNAITLVLNDAFHNSRITHIITGKKVTTTYQLFEKDKSILKTTINGNSSGSIRLKAGTSTFQLSSANFKDVLYGKAEIVSEPYYVADSSFKGGFIKKRIRLKYLFRVNNPDSK